MIGLGAASKIKLCRRERGLSQLDVAEGLHISLKAYQNIENGLTKIDLDRLGQIANILKLDITDFIPATATEDTVDGVRVHQEKELYQKIIADKEAYISHLEESLKFYREIIKEQIHF